MSVPKQRKAKSRVRTKQYKDRLSKKQLSTCPQCKKSIRPHRACPFCGYYSGREIFSPQAKKAKDKKEKETKDKKEDKKQEKKIIK
jgi:large subunit ribosomal protein L32